MHFKIKNFLKSISGFTLIEVLIAIVLLSFISLYTYKMIDTNLDTKEKVLKEDQLLTQTLTAISRIDSDFNQIYSPLYSYPKASLSQNSSSPYQDSSSTKGLFEGKTKNGMLIPLFQVEDKSTLIFFTNSNRRKISDSKESRYTWVKYSIRKTEINNEEKDESNLNTTGNNELIRQTISKNIYASNLNWSDTKAQVLLTHVKSIDYSFWDEQAKKFTNSFQDLNENKNTIRSIKLNLIWVDEENHEQTIEKTFRILYPYFNNKTDDLKNGGAYGGGAIPPGGNFNPDPENSGGPDEKNF